MTDLMNLKKHLIKDLRDSRGFGISMDLQDELFKNNFSLYQFDLNDDNDLAEFFYSFNSHDLFDSLKTLLTANENIARFLVDRTEKELNRYFFYNDDDAVLGEITKWDNTLWILFDDFYSLDYRYTFDSFEAEDNKI